MDLQKYFTTVEKVEKLSRSRLENRIEKVFGDIELNDKSVLDIGGGSGYLSFYAALMGAREAMVLEPEQEGSSENDLKNFDKIYSQFPFLSNIRFENSKIDEFDSRDKKFDIVILFNSINHLNEQACINLLKDKHSMEIYKELFQKISLLSNTKAKIIICDNTRYNFYDLLNLKNPHAPTIEWHKHQSPKIWASLLSEVGFSNKKIKWNSNITKRFGSVGRKITANKFMSYFRYSYFCLKMEKMI